MVSIDKSLSSRLYSFSCSDSSCVSRAGLASFCLTFYKHSIHTRSVSANPVLYSQSPTRQLVLSLLQDNCTSLYNIQDTRISASILNMSDTQSLGASYYIKHVTIISVFSGLASVAVGLRFWARRIQKMSLEWNDYFIVLGLVWASLEYMSMFVHLTVTALCSRGDCHKHIW